MNSYKSILFVCCVFCIAFDGLRPAHATYLFSIDELSVTKNGVVTFMDDFNDGVPPPSAPDFSNGQPADYFVQGTLGPEAGGKLQLNSSGTIPSMNATGVPVLFQGAILHTNIQQGSNQGLRKDDSLMVTAVFDLISPAARGQSYGVRFTDRAEELNLPGDDLAEIQVIHTLDDQLLVRFLKADFIDHTIDFIDQAPLDTSKNQIALTLAKAAGLSTVMASYAYFDGTTWEAPQTFANPTDIFHSEDWTRVQLDAREIVVPEPATFPLFLSGLAALGILARRRRDPAT